MLVPELMTVDEVAERLRVSEQTVWRYIKAGALVAKKIGGQWRIRARDYAEFADPQRSTRDAGDGQV